VNAPPTLPRNAASRLVHVLIWAAAVLLLLVAGVVGTIVWLLQTSSGLAAIARAVTAFTPVRVQIEAPKDRYVTASRLGA